MCIDKINVSFGSYDTTKALRLYKIFSPTTVPFDLPQIDCPTCIFDIEKIKNLYDKLTVDDKKALGWSDEMIKNMDSEHILGNLWRRVAKAVK